MEPVRLKLRSGKMAWQYRYRNPISGKRTHIAIPIANRREADKAFDLHIESLNKKSLNLPDDSGWRMTYTELITRFIVGHAFPTSDRREKMKAVLERNELRIDQCSDFNNKAMLTQRALELSKKKVKGQLAFSAHYLRKSIQSFLKQVTKWAHGEGLLPQDPLLSWRSLPLEIEKPTIRAFTAEELCDVIEAAEEQDALLERENASALVIETLLVTGNRPSAIFNATAEDLRDGRIHLPPGSGRKFNGMAALVPELQARLKLQLDVRGAEKKHALLASPDGAAIDRTNFARFFERCILFAAVKRLWSKHGSPQVEPLEVAYRLHHGRCQGLGGNPALVPAAKREAKDLRDQVVERIAKDMRAVVDYEVQDLYLYRLRHTHQSWAEAANVTSASIDAQIGHVPASTGGRIYRDPRLVDPSKSAEAVWEALQKVRRARSEAKETVRKAVGAELQPVDLNVDLGGNQKWRTRGDSNLRPQPSQGNMQSGTDGAPWTSTAIPIGSSGALCGTDGLKESSPEASAGPQCGPQSKAPSVPSPSKKSTSRGVQALLQTTPVEPDLEEFLKKKYPTMPHEIRAAMLGLAKPFGGEA